jgi:hypothetical protein
MLVRQTQIIVTINCTLDELPLATVQMDLF